MKKLLILSSMLLAVSASFGASPDPVQTEIRSIEQQINQFRKEKMIEKAAPFLMEKLKTPDLAPALRKSIYRMLTGCFTTRAELEFAVNGA